MNEARIHVRNAHPIRSGDYVLYWMQQAQRLHWNHAFEYALQQAELLGIPVRIVFGITPHFPEANLRHYAFMIDGLKEVAAEASKRGILISFDVGSPADVCLAHARKAALVVMDMGYLKVQRTWRQKVAQGVSCRVVEVESDVVVPVEVAAPHEMYAARFLRLRINKILHQFLESSSYEQEAMSYAHSHDLSSPPLGQKLDAILEELPIDRSVGPIPWKRGGTTAARNLLESFIETKLNGYASLRNDPALSHSSELSPYLHFGQISPLYVVWRIMQEKESPDREAFLEQLIVRRELSMNFAYYCSDYDNYQCLPSWARDTLEKHVCDSRPYVYSLLELEQARTHDPIWNAAQLELVHAGTIHNYMRMYWGIQLILWTRHPQEAFRILCYLNNKYALDGRDPNSFAGIAWCFGKHDRPWPERPVWGTVRSMTQSGLRSKFNVDAYVERIHKLVGQCSNES